MATPSSVAWWEVLHTYEVFQWLIIYHGMDGQALKCHNHSYKRLIRNTQLHIISLVVNVSDMSPTCRTTATLSPFLQRHAKIGDTNSECLEKTMSSLTITNKIIDLLRNSLIAPIPHTLTMGSASTLCCELQRVYPPIPLMRMPSLGPGRGWIVWVCCFLPFL